MDDHTKVSLSGGFFVGGIAGTSAVLGVGTVHAASPVTAFGLAAVGGWLVGSVLLWRRATVGAVEALVEDRRRLFGSWLPLPALFGATVLVPLLTDASWWLFWYGLAGIAVATVGWTGAVQTGQTNEARAAIDRSETVVRLPADAAAREVLDSRGWLRRAFDVAVLGSIAVLVGVAVLERDPFFLVFALPGVTMFLPEAEHDVRLTDDGLVFDNRIGPGVAIGAKLVPWDALEGYRIDSGTLTLVRRGVWGDLEYDLAGVDDERAVEVLDRYLPRLTG